MQMAIVHQQQQQQQGAFRPTYLPNDSTNMNGNKMNNSYDYNTNINNNAFPVAYNNMNGEFSCPQQPTTWDQNNHMIAERNWVPWDQNAVVLANQSKMMLLLQEERSMSGHNDNINPLYDSYSGQNMIMGGGQHMGAQHNIADQGIHKSNPFAEMSTTTTGNPYHPHSPPPPCLTAPPSSSFSSSFSTLANTMSAGIFVPPRGKQMMPPAWFPEWNQHQQLSPHEQHKLFIQKQTVLFQNTYGQRDMMAEQMGLRGQEMLYDEENRRSVQWEQQARIGGVDFQLDLFGSSESHLGALNGNRTNSYEAHPFHKSSHQPPQARPHQLMSTNNHKNSRFPQRFHQVSPGQEGGRSKNKNNNERLIRVMQAARRTARRTTDQSSTNNGAQRRGGRNRNNGSKARGSSTNMSKFDKRRSSGGSTNSPQLGKNQKSKGKQQGVTRFKNNINESPAQDLHDACKNNAEEHDI